MTVPMEFIFESTQAQRMLQQLDHLLSPVGMGEFMKKDIEPFIKLRARDRFRSEGDEVSGPWEQLAESTVAIREFEGFPGEHPINKRTGQLEEYIIGSSGDFAAAGNVSIWSYPGTPATGMLATKVRAAQEGKDAPRTPPRPVLGLGTADLMYVLGRFAVRLEKMT